MLNMPDRGNGQYQKMMLTGQLKVKDTLLEAQANLMGSEEPLRVKWWEKDQNYVSSNWELEYEIK